ncbi:hypothetical protein Tco_0371389 [Tanacetum coccineum]
MPPRKKTCFTAPSHRFEIRESSAATRVAKANRSCFLARGLNRIQDTFYFLDASIQATGERVMTALEEVNDRMINLAATHRYESEEFYTRHQDAQDDRALLQACISTLEREPMAMEARIRATTSNVREMRYRGLTMVNILTSHIQHEHDRFRELKRTRDAERQDGPADAASMALGSKMAPKKTPMSDATIKALIAQGVADALVEYEANKGSGDCDDSHNSGSGERRHVTTTFAICTLLGSALTWWNSHVKIIGHDAAYGMPRKTLMKMLTDKEKYVSGLPDMIQGSVMASKPKTMQEAIQIANDLMD